jgi:hypothetical protein
VESPHYRSLHKTAFALLNDKKNKKGGPKMRFTIMDWRPTAAPNPTMAPGFTDSRLRLGGNEGGAAR